MTIKDRDGGIVSVAMLAIGLVSIVGLELPSDDGRGDPKEANDGKGRPIRD